MPTSPASRIEHFEVTIPPGTPQSAPLEVMTSWNPGELVGLRVRIPNGHVFRTGIQILMAHGQAIPTTPGEWIQGNDDLFDLDLVGQLNTGAWSVRGYNTDLIAHTFHVTYYVLDFSQTRVEDDATLNPTPLIA